MMQLKTLAILSAVILTATGYPRNEDGKRLIKVSEEGPGAWLNEEEIFALIRNEVHFMDVTDRHFPTVSQDIPASKAIPVNLRYQNEVRDALTYLSVPRMKAFLTPFSAYHNRYYQSTTGVQSSEWLLSQVNASLTSSSYRGNASARTFSHSWAQKSVIARIEGADPVLKNEVVILGAHLDSILSNNPNGNAPGADDNGSGSTVLLETLRIILDSGFIPKRTIEFQWYAAEEVGLLGSGDIAESYYFDSVNVAAMMNIDIAGYHTPGRDEIGVHTDYTNPQLTQFLKLVVEGYLNFTWTNKSCGYACSDHASWHGFGFPACRPGEVINNPYMHTTQDDITRVHFVQVTEFLKLAVGYTIEIAEPSV